MSRPKHWMNLLLRLWLLLAALQWPAAVAAAAEPAPAATVNVYLFWAAGCPHCAREIDFLHELQQEQPDIRVRPFEVGDASGRAVFLDVLRTLQITEPSVPLTIIGNHVWVGFATASSSGAQMRARIDACRRTACPDAVAPLLAARATPAAPAAPVVRAAAPETMQVPLLGEVRLRDLSLPALTVVLGALDGFNPCAMWTLIFLIGLLLGMKDSVRMWTLGTAFIVGSAAVYFMFMAAWLNLLLFLGSLLLIRVVIGLLALGGGFYYLREYFVNTDATCPVTAPQERQKVFQRLKTLTQESSFLIALVGIVALAFLVNLVELICSAGIPAVYTQILAMHALPTWQYYAYLLLYILVFMADDLFVFITAMLTLRMSGINANYSRYSHLIGGLVLLVIGALMLLRPDLLRFG